MKKSWFSLFCRLLIASIFIVSGFFKLMEPSQNFLAVIESYKIISGQPAVLLSQFFPWVEFILGVFLLIGLWTEVAAIALWSLNTVFISVLFSAMVRHLPVKECGCFGGSFFSLSIPQTMVLDSLLWGLFAWFLLKSDRSFWTLDQSFSA